MLVFDGPVTPDALTTYVRAVPTPADIALDQLLPDRYFDSNSIEFAEITRTNRTARFRTYDGRLHVSRRDGASTSRITLPPLSTSLSMGELERLQLEFARTGGTNTAALVRAIYDDATALTREVQYRMELARGDVLTDFRFAMGLDGEPGGLEADFGAPAGHLVAPATLWTNTGTATVLTDLVAWSDTYTDSAGRRPGRALTSTRIARLMQRNAEVINAIAGSASGRTRVTMDELNDLLQSENLPRVTTYDTNVDVDGVSTKVVPDDRLMLAPADPDELGYTAWGVTATALELVGSNLAELDFEDAPGIVGVVEKVGPPYREFTFVDAVGMPVIGNPRALLVADVA